jgi:multidrug efflux pump subunit AcrB
MASGGAFLEPGAGGILSYFTRHRTAANLMLVLMIVAGLFSLPNMRSQFFPDVIIDSITVSVTWSGAGAEDVDAGIVQVLEPALLGVEGVAATSSRSSEGSARISLEFEPGSDMDRAAKDVQLAVDTTPNLPAEADEPVVRRNSWSDRVTDVVITGPVGADQLGRFADEFVARLFAAGVTRTTIQGLAAPSTIVEVPSLSMIRHDISMSEIAAAIAEEADADPAGDLSGTSRVRTGAAKRSADDIAAIVLRSNPDGSKLTIGDVARITVEGPDRNSAFFVGQNPAMQVRVDRNALGDAIGLQDTVQQVAAELQATLPGDLRIDLFNARAEQITGRLNILLSNGLQGLALVLALLFLFLNTRTALWVAAGIPVSMLAAIAVMYAAGLTFNMISIFALILTLGIVVDDAIVVGEHADFRARKLGESGVEAAENAARRMFSPVFSATVTTNIAFFGLIVVGGRFGDLIADIPFTVVAVLSVSLFECFVILPNHLAHSLAHSVRQHWYDWPSRQVNRGFDWFRRTLFRPFMNWIVWARYPVVAAALLILAGQAALFIRGDVQWRFFSAPEQGQVTGNFAMLPGATRADTMAMIQEMQRAVDELGAEYADTYGQSPIAYVVTQIGGNSGRGLAGADTKDPDQLGAITIELIDPDLRPYTSTAFVTDLQDRVRQTAMTETVSFRSWGAGPGGNSLEVQLSGADATTLKSAAEALKTELARFPEISGLEDTLAYDKDELILNLTPQGRALGFTVDGLGQVLRAMLSGIEAATYPDGPRSATIRVELPPGELTADFLNRTQMRAPSGAYVPLGDIVTVAQQTGFSTVRRENGAMLIAVTGDLSEDDADRAAEVNLAIKDDILPRLEGQFGIGTALAGLKEQESAFLNDARTGAILVLMGIYLVLAWVFASWTRPLVVMAVIPFSLVGAIWGHYHWGIPMSMFSVVGLLGMIGIIINDSIVLVTTIDDYAKDRGLIPAIVDGVSDRLRPVLLTTATTVLGLAPLLFEGSTQAEFLKPTVVTLVYGLGFGMVLVLLLVPSLMAMQMDVRRQVLAARRGLGRRARGNGLPARLGAAAALGWFVATLAPVIATGSAWPAAIVVLPMLAGGAGPAFVAFAGGLAVTLALIYVVGAVIVALRAGRAQPPVQP